MDVTVQRSRIETLWHRARTKLVLVQKQRRQGLIDGAVVLPKDCYMETDGRVYGPVAQQVIVPIPEPEIEEEISADRDPPADGMDIHPSTDGENGKYREQKETGRAVPPLVWQEALLGNCSSNAEAVLGICSSKSEAVLGICSSKSEAQLGNCASDTADFLPQGRGL
jgi:hypothetical protein